MCQCIMIMIRSVIIEILTSWVNTLIDVITLRAGQCSAEHVLGLSMKSSCG